MVEVDTSASKIKGNIFSQNPKPDFIMDRFPPSSSRKPRLNKHRKAPNRKESNYLSQKSAESIERNNTLWNPFVPGPGTTTFVFGKNDGLSGESSNFDANGNFDNTSFDSHSNANSLSGDSSLGSEEGLVFTKISDVLKGMGSKNLNEKKSENFDSGSFNELPNEMKKMNLQRSYVNDSAKSKEGGSSSKPISAASENSEKQTVFVFGSKAKGIDSVSRSSSIGTSDLFSKFRVETSQDNLKNNYNVSDFKENNQTKSAYAFEGYTNNSRPAKAEPTSFGSEISGSSDPFVFVFGSGVNNSVNSSRNSSGGPPDEPRKVNLKNTSNEGDAEKIKPFDNAFVFGSSLNSSKPANVASEKSTLRSASFRSENSDISNVGVFVFGSGVNSSTNLSRNSSVGSAGSFFSELPDDISKVNFDGNTDDFEREKQPQNYFAFGSNTCSLNAESAFVPGAIPIPNGKTGGKFTDNFVFGSEMKKNAGFSENSSFASDEGLFSKLPDVNIEKSKSIENIFMFGSNEFTTGTTASRVPKESAMFSASINTSAQSMKNVSLRSLGGEFEFGAKKDKEMNKNENNDDSNGFVFGGTGSFNPLNDNMGNLNTGTNVETPSGGFANKFDLSSIPSSPMDKPPIMDFKVPLIKETLFTGTCHNKPFSAKKSDAKNTKTNKKKDKTKQSVPVYQKKTMLFASERNDSTVNIDVDSNGDCSPMDCSPYHENVIGDQYSRGTSIASEDTEYMVLEAQRLNICVDSTSRDEQHKEDNFGNESKSGTGKPTSEGISISNFKFTATPSQGPVSAVKPTIRRKDRLKACHNSPSSTSNARVPFSSSPLPDLIPRTDTSLFNPVDAKGNISPQSLDESKKSDCQEFEGSEKSSSLNNSSVAEQALCEKWRFRGNQAYSNGHLSKAEDYYTRGVNSISLKEIPSSCIRPLTLCYSNRAVTRTSLGKIREALSDSKMAVSIDPAFLKAQVRAANCHLAFGEIGEALKHFKKCLQSEKGNGSDQKYLDEATDGLEKAQKVADLTGQSAELLLRRTSIDASKALNMICEALSFSPHSESLLEMKAEALLMMGNYTEVIELCEETLDLAVRNSDSPTESLSSPAKLWRSRMIAKSYFYLGKLEAALELFQQHEKLKPSADMDSKSSRTLIITIQELLRLKSAGNEAFQAGRHSEAVEYYSSALMCNAESRPFTAVCFCNRAAAYQALGQISDAIADCSLAIALDSGYAKAISRRATLHEMIRDYGQAANDLNRLISLLQKQIKDLDHESKGAGRSSSLFTELKRARSRLVTVEEEDRKEISLNMYMILGVELSSSAADIKKAYRKAALKHHPDKAGQSLVRNENVDDESWREVVADVHANADRLFKMIGEAYATLSDPSKRMKYDEEEEMRTYSIRSYNVCSPRYSTYAYSNYYHENNLGRQSQAHGNAYRRW